MHINDASQSLVAMHGLHQQHYSFRRDLAVVHQLFSKIIEDVHLLDTYEAYICISLSHAATAASLVYLDSSVEAAAYTNKLYLERISLLQSSHKSQLKVAKNQLYDANDKLTTNLLHLATLEQQAIRRNKEQLKMEEANVALSRRLDALQSKFDAYAEEAERKKENSRRIIDGLNLRIMGYEAAERDRERDLKRDSVHLLPRYQSPVMVCATFNEPEQEHDDSDAQASKKIKISLSPEAPAMEQPSS
jgi:hypothetical protein